MSNAYARHDHNPYATEMRFMLDLMGYMLRLQQPQSVRIGTQSPDLVKALVRRLARDHYPIMVETPELCAQVQAELGVGVEVAGKVQAEALLLPLSLETAALPSERVIVASLPNALSYKSLLYPGSVRTTALGSLRAVRQHYRIEQIGGLYGPRFITLMTLAHLAGKRSTATFFRLSDLAMQYVYDFNPLWRLCHVVVFSGQR